MKRKSKQVTGVLQGGRGEFITSDSEKGEHFNSCFILFLKRKTVLTAIILLLETADLKRQGRRG